MNKILTIFIMCFCGSVFASEVLDSETTDLETEHEAQYCSSPSLKTCASNEQYQSSPSMYIFNPAQLGGVFQFQQDWYMVNNKIKFVPVSQ